MFIRPHVFIPVSLARSKGLEHPNLFLEEFTPFQSTVTERRSDGNLMVATN